MPSQQGAGEEGFGESDTQPDAQGDGQPEHGADDLAGDTVGPDLLRDVEASVLGIRRARRSG